MNEENKSLLDSISSTKHTQTIEWGPQHEQILIDWADKALCFRWLHSKSNEHYSNLNTLYTIPVIIMSTLTGTANFALDRIPTEYQGIATIAIGSVNIIAGIITTISQFLKIAELNEAHRASAVSWSKLYRTIKLEIAKSPNERKQVVNMLNNSKEEYDRLMETSPSISEKFIKLFKETYSSRKEDKQAIFNNLNKPEVCGFIESTANSLYKAPLIIQNEIDENINNPSNENDIIEIEKRKKKEKEKQHFQEQQQQVLDFNKRFQDEKQRFPTSDEINNNFDNSIPLNIILSVIDDINSYGNGIGIRDSDV